MYLVLKYMILCIYLVYEVFVFQILCDIIFYGFMRLMWRHHESNCYLVKYQKFIILKFKSLSLKKLIYIFFLLKKEHISLSIVKYFWDI